MLYMHRLLQQQNEIIEIEETVLGTLSDRCGVNIQRHLAVLDTGFEHIATKRHEVVERREHLWIYVSVFVLQD